VYTKLQVVFDAADPGKLAEFWALALGYAEEPPPPGFETWEAFGHSIGLDESQFGDQASLVYPAGEGPRLYFQRPAQGFRATTQNVRASTVSGRLAPGDSSELRIWLGSISSRPSMRRAIREDRRAALAPTWACRAFRSP
jgi:glyoxalase superfamily protein